jgi:hypothetical protein
MILAPDEVVCSEMAPEEPQWDLFEQRLAGVLGHASELDEYHRWLAALPPRTGDDSRRRRDYLFALEEPRFEPRRDDVVVALSGLEVVKHGGGCVLRCAEPAVKLAVEGVSVAAAKRVLEAIDGERCLLEVGWAAAVDRKAMARLLRAAFGRVVLAPQAVQRLEQQLSGCEVVRFAVPPYAIERSYWSNMVAVRRRFLEQRDALDEPTRFVQLLRELHVLALLGPSLDSFYRPASPGAEARVAPGAFAHRGSQLLRREQRSVFLSGLRVRAPLLGGDAFHHRLYRDLDDELALATERTLEEQGLPFGELVRARGETDDDFGPWFCPPRPLGSSHFACLRQHLSAALAAADADQHDAAVNEAAAFHHAFVRLHPFECANQSIAMNLVNAVLNRAVGAGIPHLVLDQHALRLDRTAYQKLFARAVAAHAVVEPSAAARLATLYQRKRSAFAFMQQAEVCNDRDALEALVQSDADGARFALLATSA